MSESAFLAVWLSVPFLGGLGSTVLLRAYSRLAAVWAALAGVVLAVGFVLSAYLGSPRTYQSGTESELYLGRYWEPQFVGFIVGGGFVLWLIGVCAGAALGAGFAAARRRSRGTER